MDIIMNKTLLVMSNEIGATLRRKTFMGFAFGLPLVLGIIALIVMAVNRNATPGPSEATQDVTTAKETSEGYVDPGGLIVSLPTDTPPGWLSEYPSQASAQGALEAGDISAYYLIPADYVENGQIVYVRLEHNPVVKEVSSRDIERVLLANLLEGDAELAARVWDPLDVQVTRLTSPGSEEDADSWIVDYFPNLMTLILYMVILLPAGGLVNSLTDEKKNRVMEVLMSSVSPQQMISGKIVALGLLGLLQTALWVGILWAVATFGGRPLNIPSGFEVPGQLLVWALIYFLLGYAMYGALMAGLGALAPDLKESRGPSFVVMSPMIIVYTFMVAILEVPDGPIALVLSLFPLTSPVGMIARMTATDVPVWQPVLAAALQLLTAVLIVRLVGRLFRAQALLSGQPFSVGGFLAALLGRA